MLLNLLLIALVNFKITLGVFGTVILGHDPSLDRPIHSLDLFPVANLPTYPNSTRRLRNIRELTDEKSPDVTPLYQGYGTHFSYIYVGTPPQRQSVIVDTGSHWTAFPCTGCKDCGKHTDSYWDMGKSSTAKTVDCGGSACSISQSYAEGSSWRAVQITDQLFVSGLTEDMVRDAQNYSVEFKFGCQTSETGLFRTQLADGIMGFSMSEDTLPSQLFTQKVVNTRMFAMCFRVGGGILTLGGVDQNLHQHSTLKNPYGHSIFEIPSLINWAKLRHPSGSVWYTVQVLGIRIQDRDTGVATALTIDTNRINSGKGIIVDSGTTDTYLPAIIKSEFSKIFKKVSGQTYTEADIRLTAAQLAKMPNIIFAMEDIDGNSFDVIMPWTSYVDSVGKDVYALRVYLTEGSGGVLGANFMLEKNVIFDRDENRVGFAPSTCVFNDFGANSSELHVTNETLTNVTTDGCTTSFKPSSMCNALCDATHQPNRYIAHGFQQGIDSCRKSKNGMELALPNRACHELCDSNEISIGPSPSCIISKWSDCSENCTQTRNTYSNIQYRDETTSGSSSPGSCGNPIIESRSCNIDACPIVPGDYMVIIDLRVNIPAVMWSHAYSNTFEETFAELFMVPVGSVAIYTSAAEHDVSQYVKLRFEMRLKKSNYNGDVKKLVETAEGIPTEVRLTGFPEKFLHALITVSDRIDHLDYSRYGWLRERDISVLNTMSIPLGGDNYVPSSGWNDHSTNGKIIPLRIENHQWTVLEIILLVLIAVIASFVSYIYYLHIKLKQEYKELMIEKLKLMKSKGSAVASGGRKLVGRMWNGAKITGGKYNRLSVDDVESGSGVEMSTSTSPNNKKRGKRMNAGMTSEMNIDDGAHHSSHSNVLANSIQSLSNIVNQITNPQAYDSKNKHRNDSKYKYELVRNPVADANPRANPQVVCATDGMEDDFEGELHSSSDEGTGSDEETVWNPVNGLKPLGRK